MKQIAFDEMKQIELEILKRFHKICVDHNLKYSISGGTCLGAVRHGGFIPWDDDIDINMPRYDYEKFLSLAYEDEIYKVLDYKHCKNYYYPYARMIDKRTEIVNTFGTITDTGVFIEIFPTDYVETEKRERVIKKAQFLAKFRVFMNEPIQNLKNFKNAHKFFVRVVLNPFRNKIQKVCDKLVFSKDYAEYSACLLTASYGMREFFPSDLWENVKEVAFENTNVCCLSDYDTYLKGLYGDYMILPPPEKQVPPHQMTAYWRS